MSLGQRNSEGQRLTERERGGEISGEVHKNTVKKNSRIFNRNNVKQNIVHCNFPYQIHFTKKTVWLLEVKIIMILFE